LEKNIKGFYYGVSEETVRIILTNQNNPSREAQGPVACNLHVCFEKQLPRCFPKFAVACGRWGSHCFCFCNISIVFYFLPNTSTPAFTIKKLF
jgi:hypothetical protein